MNDKIENKSVSVDILTKEGKKVSSFMLKTEFQTINEQKPKFNVSAEDAEVHQKLFEVKKLVGYIDPCYALFHVLNGIYDIYSANHNITVSGKPDVIEEILRIKNKYDCDELEEIAYRRIMSRTYTLSANLEPKDYMDNINFVECD